MPQASGGPIPVHTRAQTWHTLPKDCYVCVISLVFGPEAEGWRALLCPVESIPDQPLLASGSRF
jgi:hypothetical protein